MTQESYQGLSSITQAVLDAAISADGESMHVPYEAIVAAALRAAADESYSVLNVPAVTPLESDTTTGMRIAYSQYRNLLHGIAKELEKSDGRLG